MQDQGEGEGRASFRSRQSEMRQGYLLLDWTLLADVHPHLRLRIGDAGHHGAGACTTQAKGLGGSK